MNQTRKPLKLTPYRLPSQSMQSEALYECTSRPVVPKQNCKIGMIIALVTQNQDLQTKIKQFKKLIQEQQLKEAIFAQRVNLTKKKIADLQKKKQEKRKQEEKLLLLNQSIIPNKSAETSTINDNQWTTSFIAKQELQNLLETKRGKKTVQPRVKGVYTLDLTSFMQTLRKSSTNQQSNTNRQARNQPMQESIQKFKGVKGLGRQSLQNAQKAKITHLQLNQQAGKDKVIRQLCDMRSLRRMKHNPEC